MASRLSRIPRTTHGKGHGAAFLLLFLTFIAARAQNAPPLVQTLPASTRLADAAQDSTGRVWAITNAPPALLHWTGAAWKTAPPPVPNTVPAALNTLPGGAVGVVWNGANNSHTLAFVRGDRAQKATQWTGPLVLPRIFGTKNGDVWLTGAGGDVYRVQGKTAVRVFNPDAPGKPADRGTGNPLLSDVMDMTEDGQGRLWFWTPTLPIGADPPAPRFLVYAGGNLAPPRITGLPDDPVNAVAVRDARHVWLAIRNRGIFEVDISAMTAQFVPSPQGEAFRRVQTMGMFGARFGVVTTQGGDDNRSGVLWLWTDNGWARAVNGLDNQPALHDVSRRPVLSTKSGVWISSYGAGAWLLPPVGPSRLLDWRVGFLLPFPDKLFLTPASTGGLLALSLGDGQSANMAVHLEDAARRAPETSVLTFAAPYPPVQTGDAHLWRLDAPRTLPIVPPVLSEWDGSGAWNPHALPPGTDGRRLTGLRLGPDGRLWCVPTRGGRRGPAPAFAFTPGTGQWTTETAASVPALPVNAPRPAVPSGVPAPDPGSLAKAADGTLWLTSGHVLYRVTADGKAVPVFPPNTPTPFADGRRVREALVDPQGSVFLRTDIGGRIEYVLIPKR